MDYIEISSQLNDNFSKSNGAFPKNKFLAGRFSDCFFDLIKNIAPYGKGLLVAFEDSYKILYKTLSEVSVKAGGKLFADVFDNGKVTSVDKVSHMFNLSEDIRYVVYSDLSLSSCVTYYAKIQNIPIIYIPSSLMQSGSLSSIIKLNNGKKEDKIPFVGERYIILDSEFIKDDDKAETYAYIVSQVVTLLDYRVFCSMVRRKPDSLLYGLVKGAVSNVYPIFKFNREEQNAILIKEGFNLEIADCLSQNTFIEHGSVYAIASLTAKDKGQGSASLLGAKKIMQLFSEYLSLDYAIMKIPDYNQRAEKLALLTGKSEGIFLNSIKKQLFYLNKYLDTVALLKKDLKDEVERNAKTVESMIKIYTALISSKSLMPMEEEVISALKYAGDFTERINVVSLMRESGILEFIND